MNRIQKVTIALLIGYAIWELAVRHWMRELPPADPVLRIDLVFIYPVLIVLVLVSVLKYIRNRKGKL